jgi:hypothetical protein
LSLLGLVGIKEVRNGDFFYLKCRDIKFCVCWRGLAVRAFKVENKQIIGTDLQANTSKSVRYEILCEFWNARM